MTAARKELELLALACEQATGADRELDLRIAMLLDPEWLGIYEGNVAGHVKHGLHPAYTGSLDAAETLVPTGWSWTIPYNWPWQARIVRQSDGRIAQPLARECATGPLALCAAALKAQAALRAQVASS